MDSQVNNGGYRFMRSNLSGILIYITEWADLHRSLDSPGTEKRICSSMGLHKYQDIMDKLLHTI